MTFPTPNTLIRKPYVGDSRDMLGNTIPAFGDPVTVPVISIAPHIVEHGSNTTTETAVADLDVRMPKTAVNLKDRFVVDGQDFEVIAVKDWTRGFHGWQPGIVVELRRVE